jgi:hypothetical protein
MLRVVLSAAGLEKWEKTLLSRDTQDLVWLSNFERWRSSPIIPPALEPYERRDLLSPGSAFLASQGIFD